MLVLVLAVTAGLVFSFLCSIAEGTLLTVTRTQVEAMVRKGTRAGKLMRGYQRDIDVPIAAVLTLNTLAHTIGATIAGSQYERLAGVETLWIFSVAYAVAVLVFAEIIPKTLGVNFAHQLAVPVALALPTLILLLKPLIYLTNLISRVLTRGQAHRPATSIEEIRLMAALGRTESDVGPRIAAFIEGVTSLRELTVFDVMVPRHAIVFLSGDRTLEENLEVIRQSGLSRLPYTPTGELDDVEGVVLVKELLFQIYRDPEALDWKRLVTPLLVVPETKTLDHVLRLFQEERKHLAVVVDEYGGTQGVVSLEDVLEEIVGEIHDETDHVEKLIVLRPDGSFVCRGWAETRKVFKLLDIDDKSDFVTIGGFVADLLGHVPVADEVARYNGVTFKVLKASARRAERIEVTPTARPAGRPTDPPESAPP
ncbi:MAG: HlyC/CorC family transporter [Myxococcales bacterium]|nr:HlyC/CorC family transporter [Myxococcales bacterium]